MSETRPRKTILSRRVARDMEHERYHPELEQEIKECLYCLECNARMFDLEVDPDLVEQRIYERQALLCRYRYLLQRARELGPHPILTGLPAFPQAGGGGPGPGPGGQGGARPPGPARTRPGSTKPPIRTGCEKMRLPGPVWRTISTRSEPFPIGEEFGFCFLRLMNSSLSETVPEGRGPKR